MASSRISTHPCHLAVPRQLASARRCPSDLAPQSGARARRSQFADVSGPGAANVDTDVHNADVAYTLARQSRLPLPVRIRVRNGSIIAVRIDGGWHNVWSFSHTASLVSGVVSLALGVLLIGWPWFRRMGRAPTARGLLPDVGVQPDVPERRVGAA